MPEKKDGKTVMPGARSPVLYFIAALAASAVSLFLMVSNSRTIYGVVGEMHDRHYILLTAASDLILMDVRLTMAADLAAATGEAGYAREYERLAPELDASIKKIGLLAPEAEGSPYTEEINEANLQLADMERRALRLALYSGQISLRNSAVSLASSITIAR